VDEETRSIVFTTTYSDRTETDRIGFDEIANVEIVTSGSEATWVVNVVTHSGERRLLQLSDDPSLEGYAEHVAHVMDKPLVDDASEGDAELLGAAPAKAAAPSLALGQGVACHFTEPFFTVNYDAQAGRLSVESFMPDGELATSATSNTTLVQDTTSSGSPEYEVDAASMGTLTFVLDYKGSDGMSDETYPYSGTWVYPRGEFPERTLWGACEPL